jgi:hypothetical protein
MGNSKTSDELVIAYRDLAFQYEERDKRAAELIIANRERDCQSIEKQERAAELRIANKELAFQNKEKANRAAELLVANIERDFQNSEKESRAAELLIANIELAFQNEEKVNRAAELLTANKELIFQNHEKEQRAFELLIANKELAFLNKEKANRAAELLVANKELIFQNTEKEKRAAELVIANIELAFQNEEKANRAAKLLIANKELIFQNREKEQRATELKIVVQKFISQDIEKDKLAAELLQAKAELALLRKEMAFHRKRDDFVNGACYELQKSLISISSCLHLLKQSPADQKITWLIAKALDQVKRVSRLMPRTGMSGVLEKELPIAFDNFGICDLVKEVMEIIHYIGITREIEDSPKVQELLAYTEQTMVTLVSNAAAYPTQPDHLRMIVSQIDSELHISLLNFGIEVKDYQKTHISSIFYRGKDIQPHISDFEIGIHMSDNLTSNNRVVCVKSKFEDGSLFSFTIPLEVSKAEIGTTKRSI